METEKSKVSEEYVSGENLTKVLSSEKLKEIGCMVVTRMNDDWRDSQQYRTMQARHLDLFSGRIPGKRDDTGIIQYVHLPYITKAVLLYHGKMHGASFPEHGDLVAASTMRPGTEIQDRKLSRLLNFTLRHWVPEYIPCHDRGDLDTLVYGSAFSIWRWSSVEERPVFDFATTDTVVVPYVFRSNRPDMSDVPWFTWILRLPRYEIEMAAAKGDYDDSAVTRMYADMGYHEDGTSPAETVEEPTDTVHATADRIMGQQPKSDSPSNLRRILWHHCWLKLDGWKQQRPVEIYVDEQTKEVVRLALREKPDPADVRRYRRDKAVHDATVSAQMAQYDQVVRQQAIEHEMTIGSLMQANVPPGELPPPPDPPPSPTPPQPPLPPRMIPVSRITHYSCLPNPEGFYGYGIALLAEGHNIVADETMSMYTTSLRHSMCTTGIYSSDARGPRGELNLTLGKWHEVRIPPEQLDKAFKQIMFPPPDSNAFKVEQRQADAVAEITADPILLGEAGKSGQTATEANIRSANAMVPITSVSARINRARMNEMRVLIDLLREMLPDTGFAFFNYDQMGEQISPEKFTVTPEDFGDELMTVFTTDPSLTSQPQRERTAMRILDAIHRAVNTPAAGQPAFSPEDAISMVHVAAANLFRAMNLPQLAQMVAQARKPSPTQPPTGGTNEAGSNTGGLRAMGATPGDALHVGRGEGSPS